MSDDRNKVLLTVPQAVEYIENELGLRVGVSTFYRYLREGRGPKVTYSPPLGRRRMLVAVGDLEAYVASLREGEDSDDAQDADNE